jgi:hypothetical protein
MERTVAAAAPDPERSNLSLRSSDHRFWPSTHFHRCPQRQGRGRRVPRHHADYANPDAVATFVEAARRVGADLLACFLALFRGAESRTRRALSATIRFLALLFSWGIFRNHFGSRCVPNPQECIFPSSRVLMKGLNHEVGLVG